MKDALGIGGHIEVSVIRKDGTVERAAFQSNAIEGELKNTIASSLQASSTFNVRYDEFDLTGSNYLTEATTASHQNKSGIIIKDTTNTYYPMDMSMPSTHTFSNDTSASSNPDTGSNDRWMAQGVVRNNTGSSVTFNAAYLGHKWQSAAEFTVNYANSSPAVTLADGEELTVKWEMKLT